MSQLWPWLWFICFVLAACGGFYFWRDAREKKVQYREMRTAASDFAFSRACTAALQCGWVEHSFAHPETMSTHLKNGLKILGTAQGQILSDKQEEELDRRLRMLHAIVKGIRSLRDSVGSGEYSKFETHAENIKSYIRQLNLTYEYFGTTEAEIAELEHQCAENKMCRIKSSIADRNDELLRLQTTQNHLSSKYGIGQVLIPPDDEAPPVESEFVSGGTAPSEESLCKQESSGGGFGGHTELK